jgi:hypothetical protein
VASTTQSLLLALNICQVALGYDNTTVIEDYQKR